MNKLTLIGRAEQIDLPEADIFKVPARIDTGAKTSSIWASQIKEVNGCLEFKLFAKSSNFFNNQLLTTKDYEQRVVASSNGQSQTRYVVKLKLVLHGRKIRASFTLANRSAQAYPVLVGRNVLRGKFLVDVKQGKTHQRAENSRSQKLQSRLRTGKES